MKKADIGLVGLAVMGENLALNMESKGFSVAVFNIETERVDAFINGRGAGKNFTGAFSFEKLCTAVEKPRKIMLMIRAGSPVDETIGKLIPFLEKGDIIIDGGNSHFGDTANRIERLKEHGILYIGTGVSGGEEGALTGPSIMPGGDEAAWPLVKPIFQAISAKAEDGSPCCEWVGTGGAGHFVKMVHNGIEYGDMQLICEAYDVMRGYLGMSADEIGDVFAEWNRAELSSYLIEITAEILRTKDTDGSPLVEKILDTAGQKGTGKWTAVAALDEGIPVTLISEAVFARCLSAAKNERVHASKVLGGVTQNFSGDRGLFIQNIKSALYAAKIISYAQGFALLRATASTYGWELKFDEIARMWRGGCIIRSAFLGKISEAFAAEPGLINLCLATYFTDALKDAEDGWRKVCAESIIAGIPIPSFSAALAYYDGYRAEHLPANLLQAQRDYFGAHTYERIDAERGKFFHTNWTGRGGNTASTTYNI